MVRGSVVGKPLPGRHKLLKFVEECLPRPLELRFMTANLLIPELGKLPVMARVLKESRRIGKPNGDLMHIFVVRPALVGCVARQAISLICYVPLFASQSSPASERRKGVNSDERG